MRLCIRWCETLLGYHLDINCTISGSVRIHIQHWIRNVLIHMIRLKFINLLWRWWLRLIFELTIREAVLLIKLLLINFK